MTTCASARVSGPEPAGWQERGGQNRKADAGEVDTGDVYLGRPERAAVGDREAPAREAERRRRAAAGRSVECRGEQAMTPTINGVNQKAIPSVTAEHSLSTCDCRA
jgi:hypothetical protein